jgi:hypothetical protein
MAISDTVKMLRSGERCALDRAIENKLSPCPMACLGGRISCLSGCTS